MQYIHSRIHDARLRHERSVERGKPASLPINCSEISSVLSLLTETALLELPETLLDKQITFDTTSPIEIS